MMNNELRKSARTEEFDYNFAVHALANYKNPRVKINDLIKKKHIIRVKKGLYVFGPDLARQPYSREVLANLIYGPSYISLEYALSFYGIIPERVEVVTSVTNKRKKIFRTPVGQFSYKYIHPDLFSSGITLYTIDQYRQIFIAEKEKALCDLLYFSRPLETEKEMSRHLFESLRVQEDDIKNFSSRKVKLFASNYGKNVELFRKVLDKLS